MNSSLFFKAQPVTGKSCFFNLEFCIVGLSASFFFMHMWVFLLFYNQMSPVLFLPNSMFSYTWSVTVSSHPVLVIALVAALGSFLQHVLNVKCCPGLRKLLYCHDTVIYASLCRYYLIFGFLVCFLLMYLMIGRVSGKWNNKGEELNLARILTVCEGKGWEFHDVLFLYNFFTYSEVFNSEIFSALFNQCLDFTSDPNDLSAGEAFPDASPD